MSSINIFNLSNQIVFDLLMVIFDPPKSFLIELDLFLVGLVKIFTLHKKL
jgi:hypothetical protein